MKRQQDAGPKARVLIVAARSLFEEGIEELLRQEAGLEIVGRETDPQEAVRLIKEASPDVVLLLDGETETGLGSQLIHMVREGFRIRVVEVHLATNTLCLYSGERQAIHKERDLVDTVRQICDGLTRDTQVPLTPAMGQAAI